MANKNYQYLTQFDSPNYTAQGSVPAVYGQTRLIAGYTYHWWGDPSAQPTFDGIVSWLCRPNGNTSAHYVVEDGRVACIVSPFDAAWHAGSAVGNATTIGIEMNPRASEGDYRTVAQLSSQLIDAFGDQLKYGHRDWISTQCPGVYDVNKIDADSYKWISGADWGDVTSKEPATPTPAPVPPAPAPIETTPEWIKNLKDIEDLKLTVIPATGARRVNLITSQEVDDVIPRGTQIDIAKETTVAGKRYYISQYSAKGNLAIGILASNLGTPITEAPQEKPEWLKNLNDIADQDFWTRSETPVLSLADGTTVNRLPINTKVRVTHSTVVVGTNLLVLDGSEACIETVYLSDTPIANPTEDLEKRVSKLEEIVNAIVEFFKNLRSK